MGISICAQAKTVFVLRWAPGCFYLHGVAIRKIYVARLLPCCHHDNSPNINFSDIFGRMDKNLLALDLVLQLICINNSLITDLNSTSLISAPLIPSNKYVTLWQILKMHITIHYCCISKVVSSRFCCEIDIWSCHVVIGSIPAEKWSREAGQLCTIYLLRKVTSLFPGIWLNIFVFTKQMYHLLVNVCIVRNKIDIMIEACT